VPVKPAAVSSNVVHDQLLHVAQMKTKQPKIAPKKKTITEDNHVQQQEHKGEYCYGICIHVFSY